MTNSPCLSCDHAKISEDCILCTKNPTKLWHNNKIARADYPNINALRKCPDGKWKRDCWGKMVEVKKNE